MNSIYPREALPTSIELFTTLAAEEFFFASSLQHPLQIFPLIPPALMLATSLTKAALTFSIIRSAANVPKAPLPTV